MTTWFRAYSETLNDPKIQKLSLLAFKVWHNCLYLASSIDSRDGNIGTLDDIAFAFRETQSTVSSAFHELVSVGIIETVGETFHIAKWSKRQYKSDTSTERVKRFRKRQGNATETAPDTDTDTERTPLPPKGGMRGWQSGQKKGTGHGRNKRTISASLDAVDGHLDQIETAIGAIEAGEGLCIENAPDVPRLRQGNP